MIALLLLACAGPQAGEPTPSTPPTETPSATPESATSTPSDLATALVVSVVDGDTIDVLIDGREFRLRYIGIDTPETVDPRRPVECFGREASERNRELVEGRTVGLERDVSETDSFGRLLRYVWLDPSTGSGRAVMVNARLVAEGYATASAFPPDVKYAELFASLQAEAMGAGRGLWGPACAAAPAPTAAANGACDYSNGGEPVIKGNISVNTGERIYHVPGGGFYDQTVIDEAKGERWFCTEADAVAAGWRRSRR